MHEKTLQGHTVSFVCECGKVKSNPSMPACMDCTIALQELLRETREYESRKLAVTRAAKWARAMISH